MGSSGFIGKVIYFWIFIIGALFFSKWFGFATDDKTTIIILAAVAVVYIVFQVFRELGRRKRAERGVPERNRGRGAETSASATAVHKGQSKKKKKKR